MKDRLLKKIENNEWCVVLSALAAHIKSQKKLAKQKKLLLKVCLMDANRCELFYDHLLKIQKDAANHQQLHQFLLHFPAGGDCYHELAAHVLIDKDIIKILYTDSIYFKDCLITYVEYMSDPLIDYKNQFEVFTFQPEFPLQKSSKECYMFSIDFCSALCDIEIFHSLKSNPDTMMNVVDENNIPKELARIFRGFQDVEQIDVFEKKYPELKNLSANRKNTPLSQLFKENKSRSIKIKDKMVKLSSENNIFISTKINKTIQEVEKFIQENDEKTIQEIIEQRLIAFRSPEHTQELPYRLSIIH